MGAFVRGVRHGRGVATKPNGDVYDGEWQQDMPSGRGSKRYAGGHRYTGQFTAGQEHGEGELFLASGDVYSGEWANGSFHGRGAYRYARPRADEATTNHPLLYEGEFYEGRMEGLGTKTWTTADSKCLRYTGEFRDQKPNGSGVFSLSGRAEDDDVDDDSGRVYCGTVVEGKMHPSAEPAELYVEQERALQLVARFRATWSFTA